MSSTNVGVDIEEVKRIQQLARNPRFLTRIFTKEEIDYCFKRKNRAQHLAVRFAAKEAVWKAVSELLHRKKKTLAHKQIGLKNSPLGKPHVVLPAAFKDWERKISISLSHTASYAVAVAVFQGK